MSRRKLFEKTIYPNVEISDFWPKGWLGHTTADGKDVARTFLANLVHSSINGSNSILIESHFPNNSSIAKISGKIRNLFDRERMETYRRLYGHASVSNADDKSKTIWYTPENLRPPLHLNYLAFLSHDLEMFDARNIYLPIWVTRLGLDLPKANQAQEVLQTPRQTQDVPKKFACAVISNPEPVRMEFLNQLSKIGQVDIFGKFGIAVSDKLETVSEYRFNVCFENDLYPGYVTEKPFEAWSAKSVPIWRGIDQASTLNPDSLINVHELGFEGAISKVGYLEKNQDEYLKLRNSPILSRQIDLNAVVNRLRELNVK